MIYLDNAATTKVTQPVLDAMLPYFTECYGNPSSAHDMGRQAKRAVERARKQIAQAINARPEQIFFTSGATESNNWMMSYLTGASPYEHHSLSDYNYIDFLWKTVNDIKEYFCSLYGDIIYSHIWVNNETGEIYDIKKFIDYLHCEDFVRINGECRGYIHTDATQAFGHVPIDVKKMDIDFLSLSGHKFHAPKGVGVLYVKHLNYLCPYNYGGGQERGMRSGTENVASIVGMGKAAELYNYSAENNLRELKLNKYITGFIREQMPDYCFALSEGTPSVPNIISVAFEDVYAGDLVELMSANGVCIGAGSACSSNSEHKVSNTIRDSLIPEDLWENVVRISLSTETTMDEVQVAMRVLKKCVEQIKALK